jgi:hypothetical protein
MKTRLLFPRFFRPIGFVLAVPGLVLGYLFLVHKYRIPGFGPEPKPNDMAGMFYTYTNELALALVIVGLIFIAFSKIKKEDELTALIRLNSLYWAILINYLVLLIGVGVLLIFKDGEFYEALSPFNILHLSLILPLIIFLLRFYYLLYKNKDEYYTPPLYFLAYHPFNKIAKALSIIVLTIFIVKTIAFTIIYWGQDSWFSTSHFWSYFEYLYYITPFILLIWIYSKEQKEDEYINSLRLSAMQTAIYVNYAILLIANFSFYLLEFLSVETYNLSTIPLIFIIVFQYRLYRLSKQNDENSNNSITLNTL